MCVFKLDKTALTQRSLSVDDIVNALRLFVGEEAHVVSTKRWCKDWLVSIRPPAFGSGDMDRCITEAVHDSLLESAIVNGLHGVTKAIASLDAQTKQWVVDTDGSDIISANRLSGIDKQLMWTNNIIEAGRCFGVEAAVALQQVELHRVLSFDGSYVDPRHTWLLSDAVTRSGTTNPLNRHKMEELGGSLLQCASFEQTLDVFGVGAAFGSSDNLSGATEKLIVGQPVHVGTGSFEILFQPEPKHEHASSFVGPLFSSSKNGTKENDDFVAPLDMSTLNNSKDDKDEGEEEEEGIVLPLNLSTSTNEMVTDDDGFVEPLFPSASLSSSESSSASSSSSSESSSSSSSASSSSSIEFVPPRLVTTSDIVSCSSTNVPGFMSTSMFSKREISAFATELSPSLDIMQKCASNRRGIVIKATCGDTSRTSFIRMESSLDKYYNWTHCDSTWSQTTRVYYNDSFTDVSYNNKNKSILKENFTLERLHSGSIRLGSIDNARSRKIAIDQILIMKKEVSEECILPSRVEILQSKNFVKGPFEISLTKMWSAKNIVEAEKLQHEGHPKLSVSVKLKSPDFILERNQSSFTVGASFAMFVGLCVEILF